MDKSIAGEFGLLVDGEWPVKECSTCKGFGEIKVERARTIGYTKGDDNEIVDEHLELCPECKGETT